MSAKTTNASGSVVDKLGVQYLHYAFHRGTTRGSFTIWSCRPQEGFPWSIRSLGGSDVWRRLSGMRCTQSLPL